VNTMYQQLQLTADQLKQALQQADAAKKAAQAAEAQAQAALEKEKAAEADAAAARREAQERQSEAAAALGPAPANRAYADETTVFKQPNGQVVAAPTEPVANVNGPTASTIPGGAVMTTFELYNAIANKTLGTFFLVDAWATPHPTTIPSAQSLPAAGTGGTLDKDASEALWQNLNKLTGGRNFDTAIIFFGRDVNDWEGYNAALRAINFGYARVYWYRGGIAAWTAAKQPLKPPGQPTNQTAK
jgi:hypothetical protein